MFQVIILLIAAVIISRLGAFSIALLEKWGFRELVIKKAPLLVSEAAACDFCMAFWVSLFFALIGAALSGYWVIVASPLLTTIYIRDKI